MPRARGVLGPRISAIETGRLVGLRRLWHLPWRPVSGCRVELIGFSLKAELTAELAWLPFRTTPAERARQGREWSYPVEPTNLGRGPDMTACCQEWRFRERMSRPPAATASSSHVLRSGHRTAGLRVQPSQHFRLLAFPRSSQEALALLAQGLVHVAGIHLAAVGCRGAKHCRRQGAIARRLPIAARGALAGGSGPCPRTSTPQRSRGRAVPRPLGGTGSRFGCPRVARRTVAEPSSAPPHRRWTSRRGRGHPLRLGRHWRLPRLVGEEAGLDFLSVREEEYDFCYPAELEGDPRIQALVETVRSASYRGRQAICRAMTRPKRANWNESSEP